MANDTAWQEGWQIGSQRAAETRARKHEEWESEFQNKAQSLIDARKGIQDQFSNGLISKDEANSQLMQNNMQLRELYHPDKNPGAIAKFGKMLTNALHVTKPPVAGTATTQTTATSLPSGPQLVPSQPSYTENRDSVGPNGHITKASIQQPGMDATSIDLSTDPSASTDTMAFGNPTGLIKPGNLPIWNRPTVKNADGSKSSEYSVSFADDNGHEILVPTIVDGKFLTPDGKKPEPGSLQEKAMFQAAWQHYLKTGENLGVFDSPASADAYAEKLHNRGARPRIGTPFGPTTTTTVQGPAMTKGQEKKYGKNLAKDKTAAEIALEGAPIPPEKLAEEQQRIENAAYTSGIQNKIDTVEKLLGRKLTPEERERYVENITGVMALGATGVPQTFTGADGNQFVAQRGKDGRWYYLDGSVVPDEIMRVAKMAARPSVAKGLKFDAVTGQVVDQDNHNKRYNRWDTNAPPEVADMFKSYAISTAEKQQRAMQLSYQRGDIYNEGRPVRVLDPDDPEREIYMKASDAEKAKAGTSASLGFQMDKAITRLMTSGTGGTNLTYFNTARDHLKLLQEAGNALNNGDIQVFNEWANKFANATGDPAPNDFDSVRAAVGGELSKTFKGTGATDQEIGLLNDTINQAQSPEQIQGVIDYYIKLMNSKINAMKYQYEQGKQGKPAFDMPTNTPSNAQPPSPEALRNQANKLQFPGAPDIGKISSYKGKNFKYKGGNWRDRSTWELVP